MSRPNLIVRMFGITPRQPRMWFRMSAASSADGSSGKLKRTMCCSVIGSRPASEEFEVLAHLPRVGRRVGVVGRFDRGAVPGRLGAFHHQVVVDEPIPELLAIEAVLVEGVEG